MKMKNKSKSKSKAKKKCMKSKKTQKSMKISVDPSEKSKTKSNIIPIPIPPPLTISASPLFLRPLTPLTPIRNNTSTPDNFRLNSAAFKFDSADIAADANCNSNGNAKAETEEVPGYVEYLNFNDELSSISVSHSNIEREREREREVERSVSSNSYRSLSNINLEEVFGVTLPPNVVIECSETYDDDVDADESEDEPKLSSRSTDTEERQKEHGNVFCEDIIDGSFSQTSDICHFNISPSRSKRELLLLRNKSRLSDDEGYEDIYNAENHNDNDGGGEGNGNRNSESEEKKKEVRLSGVLGDDEEANVAKPRSVRLNQFKRRTVKTLKNGLSALTKVKKLTSPKTNPLSPKTMIMGGWNSWRLEKDQWTR